MVETSIPIGVETFLAWRGAKVSLLQFSFLSVHKFFILTILVALSQWVALTFVASYIGPAEVAAWVILGDLWDTLESATQGLVDAASIRVAKVRIAFHLQCIFR